MSSNNARLHDKMVRLLPEATENEQITASCIAGLLARVADSDMQIDERERTAMKEALAQWTALKNKTIEAAVNMAVEEIKDLAGIENHKYCQPLNDLMDTDQRYHLLESLFAIAASDGSADHQEVEEIRLITQGLLLEHKHFISARSTVLSQLKALKK